MMRWPIPCPFKCRAVTSQHSQRRPACVWSFSHSQVAIETGWEENAFRVRVEENLLRVKAMKLRDGLPRYGVCVIASLTNLCDWDPAVPNPSRLVMQKIEAKRQEWIHQIGGGIQ